MLNKLLNWFRRPKWEDYRDKSAGGPYFASLALASEDYHAKRKAELALLYPGLHDLSAAKRSERTRKGNATRKANKAKSNGE